MKRRASAFWSGDLQKGDGKLTTESGVMRDTPYSFKTRFGEKPGTNPEELIAAAHAGCFTMALSAQLGSAGLTATSLRTEATVTMDKLDAGWTVTAIHLEVAAEIPDATEAAFATAAEAAKANCPISRLLKATITMSARLT